MNQNTKPPKFVSPLSDIAKVSYPVPIWLDKLIGIEQHVIFGQLYEVRIMMGSKI